MTVFSCELAGEALLELHGAGIPSFLQGQLSCDTRALSQERAIVGAFCSVKGRVISDLLLLELAADRCALRLRRSVADITASKLQTYAQFSRISVGVHSAPAIVGVWGKGLEHLFEQLGIGLPATVNAALRTGELLALRRGKYRCELIPLAAGAATLLSAVLDNSVRAAAEDFQALELAQGHYSIEAEDMEQFTPQSLNYDLSGLIAFSKGCYTGQEVIARLHYRGKSKRRLRCYYADGSQGAPLRNDNLSDATGAQSGKVLRVARLLSAELYREELSASLSCTEGHIPSAERASRGSVPETGPGDAHRGPASGDWIVATQVKADLPAEVLQSSSGIRLTPLAGDQPQADTNTDRPESG